MQKRSVPDSESLIVGQRIGPFVLLAPLGSGGSGRVWAAARMGHRGFSKRMALKVMRREVLANPRARRRFESEARLGAQLSHGNLRAVHELGTFGGQPYMAMRWAETSLEELLEQAPEHRLSPEVACWVAVQCCAALSAAHEFVSAIALHPRLVHRDVSPGNILLSRDGHALLSDLSPEPPASGDLQAGDDGAARRFFGSLGYASPEALAGRAIDQRADVFSLGCVLYEALCGSVPFEADTEHALVFQIVERGATDLSERASDLPPDLVQVVARAMAREPGDRFDSAEAMRRALWKCLGPLDPLALEEQTARTLEEVLGDRIRAREQAMRLAHQRFAPSAGETSHTLPIRPAPPTAELVDLSEPPAEPTLVALRAPARSRRGIAAGLTAALVTLAGTMALIRSEPAEPDPGPPASRRHALRPEGEGDPDAPTPVEPPGAEEKADEGKRQAPAFASPDAGRSGERPLAPEQAPPGAERGTRARGRPAPPSRAGQAPLPAERKPQRRGATSSDGDAKRAKKQPRIEKPPEDAEGSEPFPIKVESPYQPWLEASDPTKGDRGDPGGGTGR